MEAYQGGGILCVWGEKRKKMMECEEGCFSSYVWSGVDGKVMKK
jgi:hypothetical protein